MKEQKKLKIVFITNNYTPYSAGVVSSIDSFAGELRKLGHKVYIITLDFDAKTTANDPPYVLRIKTFFKFYYSQKNMAVPWMPYLQILRMIKKIKPDIIHVHHPFLLGRAGLHVAKKLHIPIVFTYHTLYEKYTHYVPLLGGSQFIRKWIRNWSLRFCNAVDHVIAPSGTIKHYLEKHHIKTPVTVVPSGILPVYINAVMPDKKITKPIRFLTVTRFAKEKNIPFLLHVAQMLAKKIPLEYTFIGYGQDLEKLKRTAYKDCKFNEEQIRFIIKPPKPVIEEYYRKADFFLFGSQSETQGLVVAEAMAAATPVVALVGPGIQDIIVDGHNGYLVKSKEEMVERIEQLINDTPLYEHLCKGAFHTAQHYTPLECTKQLLEVYNTTQKAFSLGHLH